MLRTGIVSLLAVCVAASACGPYRIQYLHGAQPAGTTFERTKEHAHGIGPLLVGGGAFFGILNPMSPALIDYTGAVETRTMCPDGFREVSHSHGVDQHLLAGLISWLVVVNLVHPSTVTWTCVRPS